MSSYRKTRITLIHHPTVALKISGFTDPEFSEIPQSGAYLGNIYRSIIPPSLPRVAALLERLPGCEAQILDLRVSSAAREEICDTIDWEGYDIEVQRVGAPFSFADEAIEASDWIGLSSHFTFESRVVRDLIAYAKGIKPSIKVMVGGADVKARPNDYLEFGADLIFIGDFNPEAFQAANAGTGQGRTIGPYSHPFADLIAPDFSKLTELAAYHDSHDGPVPAGVPFPIGFIYFTRGCPRECDFCESRQSRFEVLGVNEAVAMLQNYHRAGIRTLNFADDNLLLLAARDDGRSALLEILAAMREMKFAWEFPNGLEIGRLLKRTGDLDVELMDALFSHTVDPETGNVVGAYRVYVPVETFDHRGDYRKLRPVQDQNRILAQLAAAGLPEMDFGVVIPPQADEEIFRCTRDGYLEIRDIVRSNGDTKARYSVFHLIPIALFRNMVTKYSVRDFPEGWNFYFPVYDGTHFSARQLFEQRLRLIKEIDHENYLSLARGQYGYS